MMPAASSVRRKVLCVAAVICGAALPVAAETPDPFTDANAIAEVINEHIQRQLEEVNVSPADAVGGENLIRRLTLDLAGRIPSTQELIDYQRCDSAHKKRQLVDRLISSPDFDYHLRNELDNLLLAPVARDDAWREYLLQAVRERRPWNLMFRDMITGSDEDPAQQEALAFIKHRIRDVDQLTNEASRLFFGVSINCAQCHDHPLVADWLQDHYFGFKSFFARTYVTKKNLLGEKPFGEVKFKTTAGQEKVARAMFLTGTVIHEPAREWSEEDRKAVQEAVRQQMKEDDAAPPAPPDFSLRAQLVMVALRPGEAPFLARSIVNRTWARYFGRGLVHPLDQMHSENPASHPELLDWLTQDLIEHEYDLRRLVRGIVLSDAYARSSEWAPALRPAPELFAVATPRVLSPQQLALSWLVATANPESLALWQQDDAWTEKRGQWERDSYTFAEQFELPGEHFQVSVDEALYVSNNEEFAERFLSAQTDQLLEFLTTLNTSPEILEAAFRAVLSRPPDCAERQAFSEYLSGREAGLTEALQHVVWALIASPEFRFNY